MPRHRGHSHPPRDHCTPDSLHGRGHSGACLHRSGWDRTGGIHPCAGRTQACTLGEGEAAERNLFVLQRASPSPTTLTHLTPGYICLTPILPGASQVMQVAKNLPAKAGDTGDTWVQYLGRKDFLEKEMVNCSSIFAWRIPWTEEPGGLRSMGFQKSDMAEHIHSRTHTHTHTHTPSPRAYHSCLTSPALGKETTYGGPVRWSWVQILQ